MGFERNGLFSPVVNAYSETSATIAESCFESILRSRERTNVRNCASHTHFSFLSMLANRN